MTRIGTVGWASCILVLMAGGASASTVVIGLSNKHPLTQPQVGEVLISELRCAACHIDTEPQPFLKRAAPDLSDVGARIAPDYLRRFLASPSTMHPGTTMPDLLASESDSQRDEIAEALTHFLVAQSAHPFESEVAGKLDLKIGKELFHSVGCIACHVPREVINDDNSDENTDENTDENGNAIAKSVGVDLSHLPSKYSHAALSAFLFQPLRVRSSGRMPDMKLTPAESQAISGYLLGEQQLKEKVIQPQKKLVELGRKAFQDLNCAACHQLQNIPAVAPLGSLRKADLTRGCLSKKPSMSPQFTLDDAQVEAIVAALKVEKPDNSDTAKIAKTLTAFNCIACHVRDDFGGVPQDRNAYFKTSEKNLGDDGRIPPPLTLVGAKLQPVWLKKVLFDGESVRPYMTTRMPQYGEPNLRDLPDLFAHLDVLKSVALNIPNPESNTKSEREREKLLRTAGRELLGDKGLNCIACHNFNGKPSPINKGIDLMTTYQRLQPGWFNNFVRKPGAYRPRIVMPYSWPDGVAAHKTILDGDTEMQIEAIWYYLSLGTSAADPPGIRRLDTILSVADTTQTYRGRSSVAGFRGIAVGLPEKLSYAFNAETGTLTSIWQGEFIRVERGGQGSGGFNPAGQAIALAQDVSFLELADEKAPWPLRPVMTKEMPNNPNPLYPKNLGYQFKGYFFDDAAIPTFMYLSGTIEIQDCSVAVKSGDKLMLQRAFQFDSPQPQTVWYRALTGGIKAESDLVYKTEKLRLTIPMAPAYLRPLLDNPELSELLLRLEIPQGKSTLSFTYEPLKK